MQMAYVYVIFYIDTTKQGWEILHEHGMMVCSTFDRAYKVAVQHGSTEVQEIQPWMWRVGNYWIERHAIIDSEQIGIEYGETEFRIPLQP